MAFGYQQHRSFRSEQRLLSKMEIGRYYLAWALLAASMAILGYKAVDRCIEVQTVQGLQQQENFSSYRSASSEAGR